MFNKLNRASIRAYLSVTGWVRQIGQDMKNDERGLSGVVVAVLLILIAVLLIAAMWGSLKVWLSNLWNIITGSTGDMTKQTWSTGGS